MALNLQPDEELVVEALFTPSLRTYWNIQNAIMMAVGVVFPLLSLMLIEDLKAGKVVFTLLVFGVPLALLLIALWIGSYYRTLKCYLTSRAIVFQRGVFIKTEKTIPLTRIQDLALIQGPLMRAFDIYKLKVETAGQSVSTGGGEASLVGVIDALEFRDRVIELRNSLEKAVTGGDDGLGQPRPAAANSLSAVHETLKQIEGHLRRMADNREH